MEIQGGNNLQILLQPIHGQNITNSPEVICNKHKTYIGTFPGLVCESLLGAMHCMKHYVLATGLFFINRIFKIFKIS
jgi:hypothetical protein